MVMTGLKEEGISRSFTHLSIHPRTCMSSVSYKVSRGLITSQVLGWMMTQDTRDTPAGVHSACRYAAPGSGSLCAWPCTLPQLPSPCPCLMAFMVASLVSGFAYACEQEGRKER